MNTLTAEAVRLIKSYEGLQLLAYQDRKNGVWTIGYGHTSMAGPPFVEKGLRITEKEALSILTADLKKYEAMVQRAVKVPLNDNQYGALVSFTYNLGPANLGKSTLLKKVNAKNFAGAALEFPRWNKDEGKVVRGLILRRAAEAKLFKKDASMFKKPELVIVAQPVTVMPPVQNLTTETATAVLVDGPKEGEVTPIVVPTAQPGLPIDVPKPRTGLYAFGAMVLAGAVQLYSYFGGFHG